MIFMKQKKWIVDTTLRDGEQCPGIAFGPDDKLKLALLLEEAGVYELEVGIVSSASTQGEHCITKILEQHNNAKISVWSRMIANEVKEACILQPDIIHIGVPVSYVQIYTKLRKNKVWVLKQLDECINMAIRYHIDLTIGLEDATRSDLGFLLSVIKQLTSAGVKRVRVADTVGIITPDRGSQIVKDIKKVYENLEMEVHEHNDIGMAIANSIVLANAGADYVDCTLLGIGERAGNCNLTDFLHASEHIFDCGIDKKKIQQAEEAMIEMIGKGFQ